MNPLFRGIRLTGVLLFLLHPAFAQNFPEQTGYLRLMARLGGWVPDGNTVVVGQVEPPEYGVGGYLPDMTSPAFAGINFELRDGMSVSSVHSNDVGGLFYGDNLSLTFGISRVKIFRVDGQPEQGFLLSPDTLDWVSPSGPRDLGVQVLCNSWVMNMDNPIATQLVRRIDWLADAHDVVVVGGVPNLASIDLPILVSSTYNSIIVGLSSGLGSHGFTVFAETDGDTTGRVKPDIVAPFDVSSAGTPVVASAATILVDEANLRISAGDPRFTYAVKPQVIKSVIQTGAEKLPGWAKGDPATTADDVLVPLDLRLGAGQLDINHAELIFATGLQQPGWIHWYGWTYEADLPAGAERLYYFILNETEAKRFAATLNWHRRIESTGTPATIDVATPGRFDLEFYTYSGGAFSLLQASRSQRDNLQHLHLPALLNGIYILRVINTGGAATSFALSWGALPQSVE